jgi:hypothetical protein
MRSSHISIQEDPIVDRLAAPEIIDNSVWHELGESGMFIVATTSRMQLLSGNSEYRIV